MTCIVGLIDKKTNDIFIGGDSAGVSGLNITIRKDSKVFIRRPFIIGYTTSFRMGQLLCYGPLPIKKQTKNQDTFAYIMLNVVEPIRNLFKTHGYSKINSNIESGGTFIIGYKGRLFTIYDDFQISESDNNYCAVGCGQEFALGNLYATNLINNCEHRVKQALECAQNFSGGVRGPFNILKLNYNEKN